MTPEPPQGDDSFDAILSSKREEPNAPATPPSSASAPTSRREAREQAERAAAASTRSSRRAASSRESAYPRREKGRHRGLIASIVTLVLLAGIAGGGLYVWNTFEPQIRSVMGWEEPIDYEGPGSGEVLVSIASGDTGQDIARTLKTRGVTKTVDAFLEALLDETPEPVFHPGVYSLKKEMTAKGALTALLDPESKVERTVLVREGMKGADIFAELSAGTDIPVAEFEAAVVDPTIYGITPTAPSIEGWLFPALYTFDPDLSAQEIIQVLVDRTVTALDAAAVPVEDRERILTIASVIEREARIPDDFYKVSRVIQNRLAVNMKLEMDSTAQYGDTTKTDSVWSTQAALESDNPWNTYQRTGLPVGPIASPGDTAIAAAMVPAEGSWLFFVTVNLDTGETVFTNTVEEHEAAVQLLKTWCAENPDKGC
ncbi:endolytic transglycosylase MltG [Mycetocola zhadangensis]|uniref:Endolytic murein transglycosylase n=1 Tax=Mycetocola zhadangensis TaxID=1164595 RepID=A0A3L7J6F7_9MICO|nr:endolytic transglycosylase MltG [Mycetocola zhadangensis]RLQ86110.1 endolytic transglycosylase MltG [Mycetocola zhadangensis]GGE88458.1 ABC transporter substrate-binding protein [Mycetocola zhadangensis]